MEKKLPRIKALLTPGEVAKRSGVAVSALHFYESKGLITSIRNSGNQRGQERCAKLNHQGHPFIIGNTKEKGE